MATIRHTADLVVPATHRSTLGNRAFTVARPYAWNISLMQFDTIHRWLSSSTH